MANDISGVQLDTWQNPKTWPTFDPISGAPTGETCPANNVLFEIRRGPGEAPYKFTVKPGDTCDVFREYRTIVQKLAPHLVLVDKSVVAAPSKAKA
jgi:hypothetical protein